MLALMQQSPVVLGGVLFLLGLFVGSFLNVVTLRLPVLLNHQWKGQCLEYLGKQTELARHQESSPPNLILPASRCPDCKTALKAIHNVPVLGYVFLGGRCGHCGKPISLRYPVIEIVTALLSLHAGVILGFDWSLVFALIFLYALIALSVIDYDHQILPDDIVLPLLWIGLIANVQGGFTDLQSAVIGAIAGYMMLWILYQVHHRLTGKQGMGYGDFKLLATIGAWLGWQSLPLVLLLSSVCGVLVAGLLMMFKNHSRDMPIPFGPYLALAGWVALLWGDKITAEYLKYFHI